MALQINDITDIDRFIEFARHNLLALQANLTGLGYRFAASTGGVQLADDEAEKMIRILEKRFGQLPALYRKWYESFACVDFSQDPTQLRDSSGEKLAGLGLNCPLVFLDINSCLRLQKSLEGAGVHTRHGNTLELLPFGGSASNCEPKGVWVPNAALDPIIYNEGAGPVTMSQEIIAAFEAGGFPFWRNMYRRGRFTSPLGVAPAYQDILPLLLKNLSNI